MEEDILQVMDLKLVLHLKLDILQMDKVGFGLIIIQYILDQKLIKKLLLLNLMRNFKQLLLDYIV